MPDSLRVMGCLRVFWSFCGDRVSVLFVGSVVCRHYVSDWGDVGRLGHVNIPGHVSDLDWVRRG